MFEGLNLAFPAGQISVVIGPSGGGKTSLLRLMNRLDEPASGSVALGGTPITDLSPALLRQRVALVAQKPFLFPETVWENLCRSFRYRHLPLPNREDALVNDRLTLCGIDKDWLDQPAQSLSGGQAQRACLARALLTRPEVLLLDEPTSALDKPTALHLVKGLRQLVREGLTVVVITHDLPLASRMADRVFFLADGKIRVDGKPEEMLQNPKDEGLQRFLQYPREHSPEAEVLR